MFEERIEAFLRFLRGRERARATVEKYARAVRGLAVFLDGQEPTKERLLAYRDALLQGGTARGVNAQLSAVNAYLDFSGLGDRKLKLLKVQRRAFLDPERELTEGEYRRLLAAAEEKGNQRLCNIMLTLAGTGIRVSELRFITLEAAEAGRAEIRLKGKTRQILIPRQLRKRLLDYAREQGIASGAVFVTRTGRPIDRSNLCHALKGLCETAGVNPRKVFPHNFRHLFARAFYAVEKNLAHLADILGHSRIETTRIYVTASASAYERTMRKMKLLL